MFKKAKGYSQILSQTCKESYTLVQQNNAVLTQQCHPAMPSILKRIEFRALYMQVMHSSLTL